jgi:hypothetical protein
METKDNDNWFTLGSVWKNENTMSGKINTKILKNKEIGDYIITLNVNKFKKNSSHPDYNIRIKLKNEEGE